MDKKRNIGLLIVTAIQIVGFALLWNKIAERQEYVYLPVENNQGVSAGTPATPVVAAIRLTDESTLRQIIQSVLKQELASYTHQLAATPETMQMTFPVDPPNVKENSPANVAALNESSNVVNSAIAQRKWTLHDATALQPHVHQLTLPQRTKLMDEIVTAINRQELVLEAPVPLL